MIDICAECDHHLDDHFKHNCEGLNGCPYSSSDYRSMPDDKMQLTPEIYRRFAEYHRHNAAWGIFHVPLDDGNYELEAWTDRDDDDDPITDEERALADIFNQLSYSQRKKLGRKAEELVGGQYIFDRL